MTRELRAYAGSASSHCERSSCDGGGEECIARRSALASASTWKVRMRKRDRSVGLAWMKRKRALHADGRTASLAHFELARLAPPLPSFTTTPHRTAMPSSSTKSSDAPLFIAYVSLITLALLPIYFGAFQSLRTPAAVLKARRQKKIKDKGDKSADEDDDDDEEDEDEPLATETLTSQDAW